MDTTEKISWAEKWFQANNWNLKLFQKTAWEAVLSGKNGLINAPTGSGKTYALIIPIILKHIEEERCGLRAIWITPLKALSRDIADAAQDAIDGLGLDWKVGLRTGDISSYEKRKLYSDPPEILITTPESLHILLTRREYKPYFANLNTIVIDEWHELLGSKRGVLVELALAHLKHLLPTMQVWGISATIGNMDEAAAVLLGNDYNKEWILVQSEVKKEIEMITILPDKIERFPWAGHLRITSLERVLPIIEKGKSTLVFTNTRFQCELWYQRIIDLKPEWSGLVAMHHGSMSQELRNWVEDAIHENKLIAVVCTSSLDLGVDFRPVDQVVQIGSPKGLARFLQRAGRSGHRPGEKSKIYFVPTHSLEILEAAALMSAIEDGTVEQRTPYIRSLDVLLQFIMTLAISDGVDPEKMYEEVTTTYSYNSITRDEWKWLVSFLIHGGESLSAYNEYRKLGIDSQGHLRPINRHIATRHRLSIGVIVGDNNLMVKFKKGAYLGTIEEWFISRLEHGDTFWFAGKALKYLRIKNDTVEVSRSRKKKGIFPSWMGGRLPLSSQLASKMREKLAEYVTEGPQDPEMKCLSPLLDLQAERSKLPVDATGNGELLIEILEDKEGYHLIIYPWEGRTTHEGIASLIAYRISMALKNGSIKAKNRKKTVSFSLSYNDYGLELYTDTPLQLEKAHFTKEGEINLLSTENLHEDILASVNEVELARRRFRDIAQISGMLFTGFPNKLKREKHLGSTSNLLFDVFHDYDPDNLLYLQSYEEVFYFQLDEVRIRKTLLRMQSLPLVIQQIDRPSPFAFPIIVDRLNRGRLSTESISDMVQKLVEGISEK